MANHTYSVVKLLQNGVKTKCSTDVQYTAQRLQDHTWYNPIPQYQNKEGLEIWAEEADIKC